MSATLLGRLFEKRDTTFQQVWGADLDSPSSPYIGRSVTRDKALGLSAVFACVRLIADTVSTLPLKEFRKESGRRIEVEPQPEWINHPIPRDPSVTKEVLISQVVTSLLLDGNNFAFVWPSTQEPNEVRILDPRRVEVKRGPDSAKVFRVTDWNGRLLGEYDWTNIVHVPLITLPGEMRGVSLLEAERLTFLGAIAAEELAANFLQNGTWMSAMVEMPATAPPLDDDKANKIIGQIESKWSGSRKAGKIGILTGGATLRPLAVTPEQAQFLQTRQYDDERIFRIFRCPPALVGMTREGAVSYASSVMQSEAFEKHTIRPLVTLIESAYGALVEPGNYLRFNTAGLLRADLATRYNAHSVGLQNKFLKVDEVRAIEDLDPFGGEDGEFLETPNNNSPDQPARSEPVYIENVNYDADRAVVAALAGTAERMTHITAEQKDMTSQSAKMTEALDKVARAQRAPRRRRVERDEQGQIIGILDYVKE